MFVFNIFFIVVSIILILSIVNSFSSLLFDFQENSMRTKRLNQMKKMKTKESIEAKEIFDLIAKNSNKSLMPRLRRLLPSIGKIDMVQLERDLKLSGWDDTFTPESFVTVIWSLRAVSIPVLFVSLLLPAPINIIGICVAIVLFLYLEVSLKGEVKNIKQELFSEFPDFIRIVSGYLSADIPLVQSISDSIKYVGESWEPILKRFIIDCENKSIDFALERMKNTVDLFEVKEFISLIRLTLEQGGKAKDGFLTQADKIEELQKNQLVLRIGRRKMLAQAVQAPLLLIDMLIVGLPIIAQVMEMFQGGMGAVM